MKKIDQYNLQQASPRGRPGLESFQSDEDGLFYFHYNDRTGRPVLFSQGYESASKRDKGLESVMENGGEKDQYKIVAEEDGYFFIIRAKNNREIARSKSFSTREEAEKTARALRQTLVESSAVPKGEQEVIERSPAVSVTKDDQPARFSFNLTFYPAAESQPLRGRIEYPLEKDRALFTGLDLQAIHGFIKKHLPQEPVPSVAGIRLPRPIRLVEDGKIIDRKTFAKGAPLTVQLQVDKKELDKYPSDKYSAAVYAKNLQRQSRILVGERRGNLPGDGRLEIPVMTDMLEPNLYRLSLVVDLESGEKETLHLEGSELVQVR